jgi:hypothetical protein
VTKLSILSKELRIDCFAHSQTASIITTEEIPITIQSIDKIERSLLAKIEEIPCFIKIKKFILKILIYNVSISDMYDFFCFSSNFWLMSNQNYGFPFFI